MTCHKSALLTALIAVTPLFSNAQIVIHPDDIPREPGVELAYYSASDTVDGIEVDVGLSGEGRVWDLTSYQFETVAYDTLVDPAAAPDRESFPTANRVLLSSTNDLGINLGSGHQYEVVADSGWYMLGISTDNGILGQAIVFPTPLKVLPMPTEFGEQWDIGMHLDFGFPLPDSLRQLMGDLGDLAALIDSIYIRVAIGGTASIDGSGIVRFSGGEVRALRQSISTGGSIGVFAAGTIPMVNRRFEVEIPGLGYEMQATQTYRWFAAGVGEIASMTSMLGDNDPNFNRAAQVRVRRIIPAMTFPEDPLIFGQVQVGNSRAATLSFSNHGEGIGILSRVEFTGDLANEIEVLTELPTVIQPDSSGRIRFLWSPLVERTLEGEFVKLYHNDPTADNPLLIPLEGATLNFNGISDQQPTVRNFSLGSNYPNPFNAATHFTFTLASQGYARVSLFNMSGREVRKVVAGQLDAGEYSYSVQAGDLPNGVYQLKLESLGASASRMIVLLK